MLLVLALVAVVVGEHATEALVSSPWPWSSLLPSSLCSPPPQAAAAAGWRCGAPRGLAAYPPGEDGADNGSWEGGRSDEGGAAAEGPPLKLPRMISYGLGSRSPPSTRKALGGSNKKATTVYVCEVCGSEQVQWVGRCPTCKEWNSVKQLRVPRSPGGSFANQPRSVLQSATAPPPSSVFKTTGGSRNGGDRLRESKLDGNLTSQGTAWVPQDDFYAGSATRLREVAEANHEEVRLVLPSAELNRVLGGGLIPGGVVMIGGDPGIGKSTLLLQVAGAVADAGGTENPSPVLYVSGEESTGQVASRAKRLHIGASDLFLLSETDVDLICEAIAMSRPALAVIDSVQTLRAADLNGAPGSVSQVRECAARIVNMAKAYGIATVLVGHVTKSGDIAGPRTVEHMVDTVLYLEGDSLGAYRMLRSVKNRFGPSNEIGVFEMVEEGMRDVVDPTLLFISQSQCTGEDGSNESASSPTDGSAIMVTMEGSRPLVCEVQALVAKCKPPQSPRRAADGVPLQRLLLLIAVLQKRLGYGMSYQEVYLNVVGGLGVRETASDLAVAVAIVSSMSGIATHPSTAFIGEIGLGGEVRMVPHLERRIAEAAKFGFKRIIAPRARGGQQRNSDRKKNAGLEVIEVNSLEDAVSRGLIKPPPPPRARGGAGSSTSFQRRSGFTRQSSRAFARSSKASPFGSPLTPQEASNPGRMGYEPPDPGMRTMNDLY